MRYHENKDDNVGWRFDSVALYNHSKRLDIIWLKFEKKRVYAVRTFCWRNENFLPNVPNVI